MSRRVALPMALAAAALAGLAPPAAATTDLLARLNTVRTDGCGGRSGVAPALRENAQLVTAAKRAAAQPNIREVLAAIGYRATHSATIHVSGDSDARAIANLVASKYCAYLIEAAYREIGIHRQGQETWIVLAAPFSPPTQDASLAVAERVLELVNRARMQARMCGPTRYPPAGLLRLNATLSRVSRAHAADMAQRNYFSHEGRDGSTLAERVTRAGYRWRSVGENIAAGQTAPETVVADWIKSPQHCANLMAQRFIEMGVAYSVNRESDAGIYWVQVFAAPR